MARNATVDWLELSAGIDQVLGDIPKSCAMKLGKAVQQSTRKAARELRNGTYRSGGLHAWSDDYLGGFKSHTKVGGMAPEGEVGNSTKPGLVHLLEKGHLTMAGRRTNAYPHMAPAFNDMEEDFMERAQKAIGEALGG